MPCAHDESARISVSRAARLLDRRARARPQDEARRRIAHPRQDEGESRHRPRHQGRIRQGGLRWARCRAGRPLQLEAETSGRGGALQDDERAGCENHRRARVVRRGLAARYRQIGAPARDLGRDGEASGKRPKRRPEDAHEQGEDDPCGEPQVGAQAQGAA